MFEQNKPAVVNTMPCVTEKKERRCQHLPPVDEDSRMTDFRDQILVRLPHYSLWSFSIMISLDQASPKDIEDLAAAGRLAHTCPYFGSRKAIPQAEVKLMPHSAKLSWYLF